MDWIINKNLTSDIKHNEFYSALDSLISFKSKEFESNSRMEDKIIQEDYNI